MNYPRNVLTLSPIDSPNNRTDSAFAFALATIALASPEKEKKNQKKNNICHHNLQTGKIKQKIMFYLNPPAQKKKKTALKKLPNKAF